jgi:ABC-type branched-subunit amino acid transport system ATPase component
MACAVEHGSPTGAGLTAGMLPPSAGDILLNGRSVALEPGAVQAARLGLCPQRNVLYDALTVREHLVLFAAIRGMPGVLRSTANSVILLMIDLQAPLRGSRSSEAKRQWCLMLPRLLAGDQGAAVAAMAEAVGLAKKFDEPAASLSGGMKRKLQVRHPAAAGRTPQAHNTQSGCIMHALLCKLPREHQSTHVILPSRSALRCWDPQQWSYWMSPPQVL